jgi:hypothetical protein
MGVNPCLARHDVEAYEDDVFFRLEHRKVAEHDVRFDSVSGCVIKLTQPGEFGA